MFLCEILCFLNVLEVAQLIDAWKFLLYLVNLSLSFLKAIAYSQQRILLLFMFLARSITEYVFELIQL